MRMPPNSTKFNRLQQALASGSGPGGRRFPSAGSGRASPFAPTIFFDNLFGICDCDSRAELKAKSKSKVPPFANTNRAKDGPPRSAHYAGREPIHVTPCQLISVVSSLRDREPIQRQ